GEWYLVVPRFLDVEMGWLYRQTDQYNIFIVNRYISWLYTVPEEVKRELDFREPPIKPIVDGDFLLVRPEETDEAFKRYRPYIVRREGEGRLRIVHGRRFNLIAEIIRDGFIPFKPQPVDPEDLVDRTPSFELRDHQVEAWNALLKYGNIGVYWPPGVGKMFLGIYALCRIKVGRLPNLIIVPTRTLIEEWSRKIRQYTSLEKDVDYQIITYHAFDKVRDREYGLTIFDEHQHLPADTYSRLALIRTKYRLGTTATPWREDSRTDLIFALTGFPVGLSWEHFFKLGVIVKPTITLYIVKDFSSKLKLLDKLVKAKEGKTIIFCDSLDVGKRIAEKYNVPFVHGKTSNRLRVIADSPLTVVSRVGDEGIDVTDLNHVIEVDFLFGSRRQEAQRLGRLLHSRFRGTYTIIMTEQEFMSYEKRLYSIYERGFQVNVERVNVI
ncbi:MAG: helicase-related protein, partial [Thermoproteota archaeon]